MSGFGPNLSTLMRHAERVIATHTPPPPPSPEARACRASLAEFFKRSWSILESQTPLAWNWHLQAVCDHVQALLEGQLGKRNLLVCVPPGSAKSRIVSVVAFAWMWTRRPSWRAVFASGNPRVTTRDSLYCRTLIESAWYRQTFGVTWSLAEDENTKQLFSNTARGFRMAITAGARVTGDRGDALFVDDPLDAADAYSQSARDAVLDWWDQAFANRLNDLRTGTRCIIAQRLHEKDLPGHLLAREPDEWERLVIPMEWEESQRFTTSLGWTDPRKAEGELMFPERFPATVVAQERIRLGSSGYAGQHQQRPSAAEGEVFKRGHFGFYKPADPLPHFTLRCQSWDCAFKERQQSDFSVGFELAKSDRRIFVLDRVRDRLSYPALKARARDWAERSAPTAVLIEDAASGQSLIQDLKATGGLPVVPVKVDGDKVTRAHTVVPTYEAGIILLPEGAPWLNEFLDELHAFPRAAHDDQVDAFVQAVRWLMTGSGVGISEYYRQELQAREVRRVKAAAAVAPLVRTTIGEVTGRER
jgi:predicted phage terminase large subunit-like protein